MLCTPWRAAVTSSAGPGLELTRATGRPTSSTDRTRHERRPSGQSPADAGPQWLIAAIASIGFAFDTYEILMLPLIVRPALAELLGVAPGDPEYFRWVRLLFFVPMFCGGIFDLLGGYLTDRLGRRRVLV